MLALPYFWLGFFVGFCMALAFWILLFIGLIWKMVKSLKFESVNVKKEGEREKAKP